jgi:LacI family transcriptional regulator
MSRTPGTGVTLRDIAQRAGVTRMAVSLALRGKAGVSAATRRKITRLARELGHQPDPEVSKLLARIRSRPAAETRACLGLLTSGSRRGDWRRFVTERKYVEGATIRARQYGYRLEEFWLNEPGLSEERLGNILWSRGIEGIIIAPLQGRLGAKASRSLQFDFARFAAVEISETFEHPDLDRAIHDQYTAMQKCLHALDALGYDHIGLVLEESLDLRVNGKWTAAFLEHRHRHGAGDLVPPLILPQPRQQLFDRWFDRHRPQVIVSVDRFALGFLHARRCAIPAKVGYASLDLDGEEAGGDGLSGIDQNSPQVGATAVDMVVAAIHRGARGVPAHPVRTEVEGTWREGRSTRRRRRGKPRA